MSPGLQPRMEGEGAKGRHTALIRFCDFPGGKDGKGGGGGEGGRMSTGLRLGRVVAMGHLPGGGADGGGAGANGTDCTQEEIRQWWKRIPHKTRGGASRPPWRQQARRRGGAGHGRPRRCEPTATIGCVCGSHEEGEGIDVGCSVAWPLPPRSRGLAVDPSPRMCSGGASPGPVCDDRAGSGRRQRLGWAATADVPAPPLPRLATQDTRAAGAEHSGGCGTSKAAPLRSLPLPHSPCPSTSRRRAYLTGRSGDAVHFTPVLC